MKKKVCDIVPGDVIMYYDTVAIVVSKEDMHRAYTYYLYKFTLSQINRVSVEVKFYAPYGKDAIIECLDI
jgi:hypothetical protein